VILWTVVGKLHVSRQPATQYVRFGRTGAQFTNYLTIYRKIIVSLKFVVRSTYDSDLKRAKTSFRNIVS